MQIKRNRNILYAETSMINITQTVVLLFVCVWKLKWHHRELSSAVNCADLRCELSSKFKTASFSQLTERLCSQWINRWTLQPTLVAPFKYIYSAPGCEQKQEKVNIKGENAPFIIWTHYCNGSTDDPNRKVQTLNETDPTKTCCYTLMQKLECLLCRSEHLHAKWPEFPHNES